MRPDEYVAWLESEIESAVGDALNETSNETVGVIRRNIPSNRRKTRKAVQQLTRKTPRGFRAQIRLRFSKKYRSAGTQTERIFRRTWQKVRPNFISGFRRNLNTRLRSI